MPVDVSFSHNNTGAIITASGYVSGEDLIQAISQVFLDETTTRTYRFGLVDFSTIDTLDMSVQQIIDLSKTHVAASKWNKDIVVCFAINKDVVYGLVRIWQAYAELTGWEIRLTRSLEETKEWLSNKLDITFDTVVSQRFTPDH